MIKTCGIYTVGKKGAKRVLHFSRIWSPLWFLKEPLKVLKALWETFRFPVHTIAPLKVLQRVLGFLEPFLRVQELGFHIGDNEQPF